jgi:hypothetical protein
MKKTLTMLAFLIFAVMASNAMAMNVVYTRNNSWTTNWASTGEAAYSGNDVVFAWDGTMATSVAVSGQVSNAAFISPESAFFGYPVFFHDAMIYGPGTYTIYNDCPPGSPGCGINDVIVFTVGQDELGIHVLMDWMCSDCGYNNMDIVNVWTHAAVFGPSPYSPDGYGHSIDQNDTRVWDWMAKDWQGSGVNGFTFSSDSAFVGIINWSFNMMGMPPDLSSMSAMCPVCPVCPELK